MPSISFTNVGFGSWKENPVRIPLFGVGDGVMLAYILAAESTPDKFSAHSAEVDPLYNPNYYAFSAFNSAGSVTGGFLGHIGPQGPLVTSTMFYPPCRGFGDDYDNLPEDPIPISFDQHDRDHRPDPWEPPSGRFPGAIGGGFGGLGGPRGPADGAPIDPNGVLRPPEELERNISIEQPEVFISGDNVFSDEGGEICTLFGTFRPPTRVEKGRAQFRVGFISRHLAPFPKIGGAYSGVPGQGDMCLLSISRDMLQFSVPPLPLGEYDVLLYNYISGTRFCIVDTPLRVERRNRSKIVYELRRRFPAMFKSGAIDPKTEPEFP